ncbi:MAG: sugar transferase [Lachnospiraceae bacterium]
MYKRNTQGWLKHLDFVIIDFLCFQMAFILAYWLRYGSGNPYGSVLYRNMAVVMGLFDIIVAVLFDTYNGVLKRDNYYEFAITLREMIYIELMTTFYLIMIQAGEEYSRFVLCVMGVFYFIISYLSRIAWKRYLKKRADYPGKRSLLIITTSDRISRVESRILHSNYDFFRIAGLVVLDKDMKGQMVDGVLVVADASDVLEYACREWIDEVFLDVPFDDSNNALSDKFNEMGVIVHRKLTRESEHIGRKTFVEKIGGYTVLTISINYASTGQLLLKRLMDIVGGLIGCLITAVLYIILAPIIKIQSPGPVFFKQERIGRNGKKFKMYKFRSMYIDAEKRKQEFMKQNIMKDGMMFKLENDPRIIGSKLLPDGTYKKGVGNYIRDWSLDEFPQFINVLLGDMSLVGTRPPTVDEWEKYKLHHRARMAIKPGITGMWQCSGRSKITDFEEVVKLDTQYITEWSLGLDLKLLWKTVMAVMKKDGSM